MRGELQLWLMWEGDVVGAQVAKGGFSGIGEAIGGAKELRAFAAELAAYPLHRAEMLIEGTGSVRISVVASDSQGHFDVMAKLAASSDPRDGEIAICLQAPYSDIDRLRRQLLALADGSIETLVFNEPE